MDNPKVSIIVPVYNVEKYFTTCMDTLLNQTLKDIEIILVDDESPDNCPAMCDGYAVQDPRVKVIHKKNEGAGLARNAGLKMATGEYLAFVDPDDFMALNAFQRLYSTAVETNADVVFASCYLINNEGYTWRETKINKAIHHESKQSIRGRMLDMMGKPPKGKNNWDVQNAVWSALYRHSIFRDHNLRFLNERELSSDDLLFNLNCLLYCSRVVSIPDPLYYFRINPLSITHTVRADRITKNHFSYQHLLTFLETHDFGMDGYLRATRLFLENTRKSISQYVQSSLPKKEKIQWLKQTVELPYWQEIAASFPYRQLPLKYAIHFYLLYKRHHRLLYYYAKLFCVVKQMVMQFKMLINK